MIDGKELTRTDLDMIFAKVRETRAVGTVRATRALSVAGAESSTTPLDRPIAPPPHHPTVAHHPTTQAKEANKKTCTFQGFVSALDVVCATIYPDVKEYPGPDSGLPPHFRLRGRKSRLAMLCLEVNSY